MKHRSGLTGLLLSFFIVFSAHALPIGSWSIHLPYFECESVTSSSYAVWAATDNSLFKLNRADFTTEKITKIEGLSDLTIGTIAYNPFNDVLVVGYQSGNLDIIKGNKIYNLPDIKRSQIVANKAINNIYFIGNLAYLSTGFGIVVVDTDRNEIKDTYLIGVLGAYLAIYDITSDGTTIYAASATGIHRALLNDPFLANYASWTMMNGIPVGVYNNVEMFNGDLLAVRSVHISSGLITYGLDLVFQYYQTTSTWDTIFDSLTIRDLTVTSSYIWVAEAFSVMRWDHSFGNLFIWVDPDFPPLVNDIEPDADGTVWYVDNYYGLIHMQNTFSGQQYVPNGPVSTSAAAMDFSNGKLCVVPGGHNDAWGNIYNRDGISQYENGSWTVMKKEVVTALDTLIDINFCEIDPADNRHVWAGSWGKGLIEIMDNNIVAIYNEGNSILESKIEYPWVGIGGMEYDENGNLWIINSHKSTCLKVKKADNTWAQFDFQGLINNGTTVTDLMITENGYKWIILPGNGQGMMVFDDRETIDNTNDDRKIRLGFSTGTGALPGTEVRCMVEDKDNEVWVGTDKGIAVFYCAETIFNSGGCDAQQILIQQGSYTQILMESQVVTAIAVDGANRKWIGTESGGVFLMSEDGTEEILHFTADNSPLLNDNITGVTVDPISGEVYFSTGKGICSYKSDAVDGEDIMGDVYAYPNPVRPDYHGPIAIRGLVQDADVKITDVAGNLIYETTALGGQAIWDGNNFKGERAASGVYLVFITNEDGTQKKVTKILLMN